MICCENFSEMVISLLLLININNELSNSNFEMTLTDFYTSLAAKQEPLGAEFEKILYDHLWSLYQN